MDHQEELTIVAEVDPTRLGNLQPVLDAMAADPGHNGALPLAALPSCHFARVLLLPGDTDLSGISLPPHLLLLSDCDGSADEHLHGIVKSVGDGIDRLFGCCIDYPASPTTDDLRLSFLRSKRLYSACGDMRWQGRTVSEIQREADLYAAVQAFAEQPGLTVRSARAARRQIIDYVRQHDDLQWALRGRAPRSGRFHLRDALHWPPFPLALTLFGPRVDPPTRQLIGMVSPRKGAEFPAHVRPAAARTNQNQPAPSGFCAASFAKPETLRRTVLAAALPLIGHVKGKKRTGRLLPDPPSVHLIRFISLDDGKRLLFDNDDGEHNRHSSQVFGLAAWSLNLMFGRGDGGYPDSRWLVLSGARRQRDLKGYFRRQQIPAPICYSSYPHLTAINIERNAALRAGLHGRMREREAQRWLQLL